VDATDPALPLEPRFVGLATICRIGLDVRGSVVAGHNIAQHPPVEAGTVGDLAFADEAEGPVDRHAALVAKAGNGDVDLRPDTSLAVRGNPTLGELQRPACVGILLGRPRRLVRPYLAGRLARLDRFLLRRGVALLGRGIRFLPIPRIGCAYSSSTI
jgi:hypothetical protein